MVAVGRCGCGCGPEGNITRGRQVWFRVRAEVLSWGVAAVVLAAVVAVGARGLGADCGAAGGVATMYLVWTAWAQVRPRPRATGPGPLSTRARA